jgi:prefoldin subunit 5
MSINQLRDELRQFRVLLGDVNNSAKELRTAINSLEPAERIEVLYTIDDAPADNGLVRQSRDELISRGNQLANVVIPSINHRIQHLERDIERLESEQNT